MNQRDRQWATVIIWVMFTIMILLVFDRGLVVPADFTGLWPVASGYPLAHDAAQLREIIAAAREVSPEILARVQEAMRIELAMRVPLVMAVASLLVVAATLCTWFIWRNAGLEAYLAREVVQAEKVKRRSRIEQFVEDLDSDELDQLRTRISDDGEADIKGR